MPGSSVDQDTRSGLKVAANIFVKAGQAFEFLPGGGFVGRMMSGGAKALIDSASNSMSTPAHYQFRCNRCYYTWKGYDVAQISEQTYRSDIKSEIRARVEAIIWDKLSVEEEEITMKANFRDDLGADSLDAVELIMEFEKEFNISIPDEDAEKIMTVGDAVRYITDRIC